LISYTSGTTGEDPKGAMITHLSMYAGFTKHEFLGFSYLEDDVYLSYVPLSHIYEQQIIITLG
jgi:long-chain acyl-CoA synthetase